MMHDWEILHKWEHTLGQDWLNKAQTQAQMLHRSLPWKPTAENELKANFQYNLYGLHDPNSKAVVIIFSEPS